MAAARQAGRSTPMMDQSHPSALNPKAESFSFSTDADHADSTALVRYDSVADELHDENLSQKLHNLSEAYGDEIMSLRKDVEQLKQGGWMVTFGNQQLQGTLDSSKLDATRKRLEISHKALIAPSATEDSSSSDMKAIEAGPKEKHEGPRPLGTNMASSRFSPQNTSPGNQNRSPPVKPSGGLGLSRYAPKQSTQSSNGQSTNAQANGSSNGNQANVNKQSGKPPHASQPTSKQTGATQANGTQTAQTSSNGDKIEATKTEAPLSNSGEIDNGAAKGPDPNSNNAQTTQHSPNAIKIKTAQAKAPSPKNVQVDCGATKEPEDNQHEHPDTAVPTTEDPSTTFIKCSPDWQPLGVRRLAPVSSKNLQGIPSDHDTITFSWDFIRDMFGGKQWSPGFYYKETKAGYSILPSRSYYVLEAALDPYLPKQPGLHGAKLTAYFNPENPEDVDGVDGAKAFDCVPLFIATTPSTVNSSKEERRGKQYRYFGMYNQPRYSDKLDFDRMMEVVPQHIKMHWATMLADPSRPAWVTAMLKAHVGNTVKPEYGGPMPDGTAAGCDPTEFKAEVFNWVGQLKAWSKRTTKCVNRLSKEAVLEAFEREDTAAPPGLRLWWEYLACDHYDPGFYAMLVQEQVRFESRCAGDPRYKQHSVDRSSLNMIEEFPTS